MTRPNFGMSGREPHMQNDSGENGNWRGRQVASSSGLISRTPVEYSYTMPSGPSKYRNTAPEVGCLPDPNTIRTPCSRRK